MVFTGSRELQIRDEANDLTFPALIHYPTEVPSSPTAVGPCTMDVSPDASLAEGRFPLVVISHGSGGSHLLYWTISTYLAKHGYVVVMPEHPGNNRHDNELAYADKNLAHRPRHVRLTLDAVARDARFRGQVEEGNAAIIGHSLGGYTALAAAGGVPWTKTWQRVEVEPDPRVRALVLLAAATPFFFPLGSLNAVTVPILMLVAERDEIVPRWFADLVLDRVPDRRRVTCRVVRNAGHFSFLSPFPPGWKAPAFPVFHPAADPQGFDREAFHRQLPADVRIFLDEQLKELA